jgi:hypothetical protein
VDKIIIAAASAHTFAQRDNMMRYASFCAPYTKGSAVEVTVMVTSGPQHFTFNVWQIPSTSQAWKFEKPKLIAANASVAAEKDGFLNGVITTSGDHHHVDLRLDCTKDSTAFPVPPIASTTVHVDWPKDKWISHSSAMVPVRKGRQMRATSRIISGAPQVQVYWTGVVPIM